MSKYLRNKKEKYIVSILIYEKIYKYFKELSGYFL